MNYRHAFHAGNFADIFKHAVIALVLEYLKQKDTPFAVVDTHAGLGRYDLTADEAERTGEWRSGLGRVLASSARPPGVALLLKAVAAVNGGQKPTAARPPRWYPGSPRVARAALRAKDRLFAAELHPEDSRALEREFGGDGHVVVKRMDGYEAIKAWLPPKERRGMVLVDPPFERKDEFAALLKGLKDGYRRFATGVFVLWYPIKDRRPVDGFHKNLAATGMRRILAAELLLRPPSDPETLNGCGLVIVNPPWKLESDLACLVAELGEIFDAVPPKRSGHGQSSAVWRLVGE
ncbi:MAG: 23S rRNA (adenine(2030)-N(6))-methyltransferase RlmJ [Alphaproteobacteria bacterium]|nr:23S rRNA (adenine(2030)-N(6))-methyltransferase RlmJ [Alphaproteobacteria bacterium]